MNPPAPGPVSGDSHTNDMSTHAAAASTALPPARRTSAPACAVSSCPAATTPLMVRRLIVPPWAPGLHAADVPAAQALVSHHAIGGCDLEVGPRAGHRDYAAVELEAPGSRDPLHAKNELFRVIVAEVERLGLPHGEPARHDRHLEL